MLHCLSLKGLYTAHLLTDISEREAALIRHTTCKRHGNGSQSPARSDRKEWQECDECDKTSKGGTDPLLLMVSSSDPHPVRCHKLSCPLACGRPSNSHALHLI